MKSAALSRSLCVAVACLFFGALVAEGNAWKYEKVGELFVEVPDTWSPYELRNSEGFYAGERPGKGATKSIVLMAGREKAAGYEEVLKSLAPSKDLFEDTEFEVVEGDAGGRNVLLFKSVASRKDDEGHISPVVKMRGII